MYVVARLIFQIKPKNINVMLFIGKICSINQYGIKGNANNRLNRFELLSLTFVLVKTNMRRNKSNEEKILYFVFISKLNSTAIRKI